MNDFSTLMAGQGDALTQLEGERRRALGKLWRWAGILALLCAGGGLAVWFHYHTWLGWAVLPFLGLIVWALVANYRQRQFVGSFKRRMMPVLVRAVGPDLDYWSTGYLGEDEFNACGLFKRPDRYRGHDLIEGWVAKTHVRFSLVHAEEEHEVTDTDSDGRTTSRTEYRDIFTGLLFSADCNKHFSGCTYVIAGKAGFLSRAQRSYVQLESPEFNQAFTVHATDQVEARYLLTPSLMERILELRRRAGSGLQLAFVGSRVYLALPMRLDAFAPGFWRPLDADRQLGAWFGTLQFIVGMVDDLNLNTRIWSKRAG